jgi:hypothetical protein
VARVQMDDYAGNYLSVAGIEGNVRYHGHPVETALPVMIGAFDDRAERPEGACPAVSQPRHLGARRRAGRLAAPARLRPGDGQARRLGAGILRHRPAADGGQPRRRPRRGLRLGLRAALVPACLHGLARLRPAVGQPGPLASWPALKVSVSAQPGMSTAALGSARFSQNGPSGRSFRPDGPFCERQASSGRIWVR